MIGFTITVGGIIALAYACEHADGWIAAYLDRRDAIKRRLDWRL